MTSSTFPCVHIEGAHDIIPLPCVVCVLVHCSMSSLHVVVDGEYGRLSANIIGNSVLCNDGADSMLLDKEHKAAPSMCYMYMPLFGGDAVIIQLSPLPHRMCHVL